MKTKLSYLLTGALVSLLFSNAVAQTDITNSGGTVSAQYTDSPTGEDIAKVIDNQSSTKYLTFNASGWIQFQAPSPYIVSKYAITSANDAEDRDPKDWTFQGSVNGTTWTTLDTRSNEDFATRLLRREFTITNTNAYTHYRLQMTNNSGGILQLAEWEILGNPPAIATVYKHCNYSTAGYGVALALGNYTTAQLTALGISNNDISSLKVTSGYEVVLYDSDNFLGSSVTIQANNTCLTANSFNDLTSSLRVRAVSTNQAPSVSITSPLNNAVYTAPAAVSIAATASDTDGSVAKVEFYNGTTKLGEDATSPYTFAWNNVTTGTYTLTARATDNAGVTTTSAGVSIQVNLPATPVVTLYQHCNNGGTSATFSEGTFNLAAIVAAGGTDNDASSLKVTSGYKITLYENDNSGGASTTYTGDVACLVNDGWNDRVTSIRVEKNTSTGDWDNFPYPTINFVNNAPSHQGSQIFNTAIPDPVTAMRQQILDVCKKLHYNVNDNIRTFYKLNFYLDDYDGVAAKWGAPPEISIQVSVRHLVNVYNNSGGDYNAIRTEILGILSHEGTHGYQYEPKNAGEYDGNSDFYGFIEGLADYVRISVGLHPGRTASTGGSWRSGYTTSAFFIKWMVDKKDPNFAIKFQHTARTYSTWSWDAACREILGTGVQALWDEYQNWLRAGQPAASLKTSIPSYISTDMEMYSCKYGEDNHKHAMPEQAAARFSYFNGNTLTVNSVAGSEINTIDVHSISTGTCKKIKASGTSVNINVSDLKDGIYIVTMESSDGKVYSEKVVIQR